MEVILSSEKLGSKIAVELKGFKHSAFASQETICFEASIYIDGKKAGTVENDGRGGSCHVNPISIEDTLKPYLDEMPADASPFPRGEGESNKLDWDADYFFTDFAAKMIAEKDLKRKFKKAIVFTEAGSPVIYEIKFKKGQSMANYLINRTEDDLLKLIGADKILNLLDINDAVNAYRLFCNSQ